MLPPLDAPLTPASTLLAPPPGLVSNLRFGTQDHADELLPILREQPTAENIELQDVPPPTATAQPGEEPEQAPAVVPPVVVDITGACCNELHSQP